jgi:hypothetical protein
MKHDINNTVIVPYIIAEQVTDNADLQDKLCEICEKQYANNEYWRNQFHKSGDEINYVKKFMEQNLKSLQKQNKKLKFTC